MQNKNTSNQTPQEIRRQMEETRSALANKVDALQELVKAQIEKVKDTFSFNHHVSKHPWQAMAIAVSAGVVLQGIVGNREDESQPLFAPFSPYSPQYVDNLTSRNQSYVGQSAKAQPKKNMLGRLASEFGVDLGETKDIALRSGISLFREFAKNSLPRAFSIPIDALTSQAGERLSTNLNMNSIPNVWRNHDRMINGENYV
jgi:ElaB/YqjD/DUF883 family membrane-anchored ribosome-binding protein